MPRSYLGGNGILLKWEWYFFLSFFEEKAEAMELRIVREIEMEEIGVRWEYTNKGKRKERRGVCVFCFIFPFCWCCGARIWWIYSKIYTEAPFLCFFATVPWTSVADYLLYREEWRWTRLTRVKNTSVGTHTCATQRVVFVFSLRLLSYPYPWPRG